MSDAADPTAPLRAYLDESPSPWHAVATSAASLVAAGFVELDERQPWDDVPDAGYVIRGGALIGWRRPGTAIQRAIRIVGAHTDSPGLRLKPNPDTGKTGRAGWRQLGVEIYGGVLLNSWLDRDLGVAGRALWPDGSSTLVRVDEPLARVPQLAIHLDRDVNERGLVLDRQTHMTPVWATDPTLDFVDWLAAEAAAGERPRGGNCASTTSSRPPCWAPIGRCWPGGDSTTRCPAGRRRLRSSTLHRPTTSP